MDHKKFAGIALLCILLAGQSMGGLDQSIDSSTTNLSMSEFSALMPPDNAQSALAGTGAPSATTLNASTELAAYSSQAPPPADVGTLLPSATQSNPPSYMYYNGNYMLWNDFTATFPSNQPGMWIERAVSWSQYATLPLGGWARVLLYVPSASPVMMYEVYPIGFVTGYDLGLVQPGYYYIWYYADTLGRHSSILATNNGYSNWLIVDIYYVPPVPPTPPKPDPKAECESHPTCQYANGHCYCTGFIDDPAKRQCEKNPTCDYIDGHCYCKGLIPEDPEKVKCEQNSQCTWANGQCFCRGLNPGPNPEPSPGPEPFNPVPNPVAECEANPGCHWSNGGCHCTGLIPGSGSNGDHATSTLTQTMTDG
jgi:hypothetical protein